MIEFWILLISAGSPFVLVAIVFAAHSVWALYRRVALLEEFMGHGLRKIDEHDAVLKRRGP